MHEGGDLEEPSPLGIDAEMLRDQLCQPRDPQGMFRSEMGFGIHDLGDDPGEGLDVAQPYLLRVGMRLHFRHVLLNELGCEYQPERFASRGAEETVDNLRSEEAAAQALDMGADFVHMQQQ